MIVVYNLMVFVVNRDLLQRYNTIIVIYMYFILQMPFRPVAHAWRVDVTHALRLNRLPIDDVESVDNNDVTVDGQKNVRKYPPRLCMEMLEKGHAWNVQTHVRLFVLSLYWLLNFIYDAAEFC
jgi:hypothetical protein